MQKKIKSWVSSTKVLVTESIYKNSIFSILIAVIKLEFQISKIKKVLRTFLKFKNKEFHSQPIRFVYVFENSKKHS